MTTVVDPTSDHAPDGTRDLLAEAEQRVEAALTAIRTCRVALGSGPGPTSGDDEQDERTISTSEARYDAEKALGWSVHSSTIIRWIIKNPNLGYQLPSGRWRVYESRFRAFLRGRNLRRKTAR